MAAEFIDFPYINIFLLFLETESISFRTYGFLDVFKNFVIEKRQLFIY